MKLNIFNFKSLVVLLCFLTACKDQLDVGNPNAPTVAANVNTETGIISMAQGGVYVNGFVNGDVWLGDSYFSLPWGYHEIMADMVGADASNNQISTIGVPGYYILSNGTKVANTSSTSVGIVRAYNNRASTGAGNNAIYYQWLNMYAMNNACNLVLSKIDDIKFSGDAASRASTLKAWCYWWKGYAYASIGTMYYSGLIVDTPGKTINTYVTHDAILTESDKNFNLAVASLNNIASDGDYSQVLAQLIPAHTQTGHGGVLTRDMWKRNINTMLARNILLNKLAPFVNGNPAAAISKATIPAMAAADWTNVKTLVTNGVKKGDFIFTGRTTGQNDFFTASLGTAAALTAAVNKTSTFKISERFIQNFNAGDKRFANNFDTNTTYNNLYTYTTRYNLIDGGAGMSGVYVYASKSIGAHELVIAGSYEENALMLAEANMRTGSIDAGLTLIDDVRDYMGAGIAHLAGTGMTLAPALTELTKERRTSLIYRGLSFYDSRRWGWTYDISNGGGSYGNVLVKNDGSVNTGVTFNYNFMDYWDVPADEFVLNPPSGSEAIKNPNF